MKNKKFAAIFGLSLLIAATAFAAKITDNTLILGDQNPATNKQLKMGTGQLKWDGAASKLTFTNDGSNFKNIGSGSGGSAGFSLLSDDNADFESGTALWTASGGSFTAISSGQAFGAQSGRFNASAASQTLSSASKTIVDGLKGKNGVGIAYIKTAATDYKLQVYDGTNVLAERVIAASTTYDPVAVNFIFPSSGSVRLRVISQSDAADLDLDNAYLGEATNLYEIAQATLVTSAYFAPTAGCNWSRTSTSFGAFGATAACPGPTIEYSSGVGSPQTTDTDLPEVTVNNLPPGNYVAVFEHALYPSTMGDTVGVLVSDGTTDSGRASKYTGSTNESSSAHVSGTFTYTVAGNRTFKVYGAAATGASAVTIPNDTAGNSINSLQFKLYRYPSASEIALKPDAAAWHVDANIGGSNFSLGTTTQASYVEMTDPGMDLVNNAGGVVAQIACSGTNPSTGLTCGAGDESNGIAFSVPRAGKVLACASFSHYIQGANGGVAFQIVETPNNAQTILQEGKTRLQNNTADTGDQISTLRLCGTFSFASAGQKTLRVMYEQSLSAATNNEVLADRDSGTGQRDIHWEVYPIDQVMPMPVIANSVVSKRAGVTSTLDARLALSGASCTITSQSGGLSAANRTGAGRCQLTIEAGVFSAAPTCVVSADSPGASAFAFVAGDSALSATNVHVGVSDAATPSAADEPFAIHCFGPK